MKVCTNCILPETFPGIHFDEQGECNFCIRFSGIERIEQQKERYRLKFGDLLSTNRRDDNYDILVCYSGGKDSTYTLDILKNLYGLNILAFTLDNGFISPVAIRNIQNVIESLEVDHIYFKPRFDLLKAIFSRAANEVFYSEKSLERASTICTSCISFVKFPALKLAIEKEIPFMGFGWSPGQAPVQSSVMRTNPTLMRATQKAALEPLLERFGSDVRPYFLEEKHFTQEDRFPYNIHPLAFLEYDEKKILNRISNLGWERPDDTDPNSTNCLLNAFANDVHEKQFGYNPYVFEIANLVREGVLNREEGLERFRLELPEEYVTRVKILLQL